uniref:FLYWCH-type domain-containing protein n=1 Tax=Panagrellus redivivus TaxID=6233 RepID=A0A7E4ZST4_PANRE
MSTYSSHGTGIDSDTYRSKHPSPTKSGLYITTMSNPLVDCTPTVIKNLYDLYELLELPLPQQQQPNEDTLDLPSSIYTQDVQLNLNKLIDELVPGAKIRSNKMADRYKAWKFVQRFNNINEMQHCRRNHGVNKAGRNKTQSKKGNANCKKVWYHCKHSSCSYGMMSIETADGCELYEHGEHNHPFKPTRAPMISLSHELPTTPGWMLDIWKNLDKLQSERIPMATNVSNKVIKEEIQSLQVSETPMAISALSNLSPELTSTTPSRINAMTDMLIYSDIAPVQTLEQCQQSNTYTCEKTTAGELTSIQINNLNLIAYKFGVLLILGNDESGTFSFKKNNKRLTFTIYEKEIKVTYSSYCCVEQCETWALTSWDVYLELIETKCAVIFKP